MLSSRPKGNNTGVKAIAIRLKAIAIRLEAIALRLEAISSRLEGKAAFKKTL